MLLADGVPVYVLGLSRWDPTLHGKPVEATGRLDAHQLAPEPEVNAKGEVSPGIAGVSMVLVDATWKAAR